ncbi:MAG: AAA family ATPase [Candidatus Magasanikbacteria bacterium CG10_big_fil_rev_8_21_14_0_10_36_32]|uniref:AAA family ATPase n=1 Tax=Candidatus Magasanikbacteria bacterium CG10_big_fil_rev_8_21_14_0_10_36_32 TaxID=1974646 RepID=A0A2M6W6W1_9BACT|nr:MAG: AAA family ATPase [Candidatus Magasanikbacteria bacterium CG10_big_fil_rev_8_21_14_0_10_36_32]
MRKKNILNLIKYHAEKNESGFKNEAYDIARYFDSTGDSELAQYIMALLSGANTFVPQNNEYSLPFFTRVNLTSGSSFPLPTLIKNDIVGVINSIGHKIGVNKFLFEGDPGTGKTETAKQIARILERDLYAIDFDSVVDSKLGQTSKNIASVFTELRRLPQPEKIIILFDEIDAIALDRINSNDLREMGRVTSSVLKGLDGLSDEIVLIATTNLFAQFDKALFRRFDSIINFNRYDKEELIEVAESMLNEFLTKFKFASRNMRLFRKILSTLDHIPYPGDLKNIIKTALAFSDPNNEYDYLKKLYESIYSKDNVINLKKLQHGGFTVREIEILTGVSKSQVSRELNV